MMDNFPFKESQYDYDYILDGAGYKVSKDHETHVTFSKPVQIDNEHADKFKLIDAVIEVSRPKILSKSGRYDICSPYRIEFLFSAFPLHAIRRLQWNTFPGKNLVVLDTMIKVAEAEAKICAYNFMETDIQIIKKFEEIDKIDK